MFEKELLRLYELFQLGVLGAFGASANYLYTSVQNGRKFSWWMFSVNLFLAFFVGNVVGEFVPDTNGQRDGIIMVCGYCTYPFLACMEVYVKSVFKRFVP